MCGLFLYDPKTKQTRQLTYDQDSNWGPVMMDNGTVLYQRWEYADLPHSNSRLLFTMNPDGTTQMCIRDRPYVENADYWDPMEPRIQRWGCLLYTSVTTWYANIMQTGASILSCPAITCYSCVEM